MLKVLHIILALNVLLSTSGVTVFEHLCQMNGRTVSIFIQPKGCCKSKEAPQDACQKAKCSLKSHHHNSLSKKPCCEDKSQLLKASTEGAAQKIVTLDFNFDFITVNFLPSIEWANTITPTSQKALRFYLYKPPPMVTDIRVFIQSFLC